MNRGTYTQIVWFSLLLLPKQAAVTAQERFVDTPAHSIESFLRDNFSDGNAGMVIGLLDEHGSRVYSAGKLDNGTDQSVHADTVFEIGSISKTFTTLLLLELARQDEMKLDDPVSKYLPDRVKPPTHEGKEITLRNLAAQESGLPFNADNLADKPFPLNYNEYTLDDLYAYLSQTKLPRTPGAKFHYSNVGMALLGHVMELQTGADYESLVVDRICRPLSMTCTRISLTPAMNEQLAIGHDAKGQRAARMQLQVLAGAGALHSTANDLLKYIAANLGLTKTHLTPLMAEMQVVRHRDSPELGNSAMPWYDNGVYHPPGSELWGHSGGTAGFSTFIGFDKGKRRGVVVLSNQRTLPSGGIGWAILQEARVTRATATRLVREVVGIGIELDSNMTAGLFRISSVYPRSPAGQANLHTGLLIKKINGNSVQGKSLQECLGLMAGPAGTKLRLELVDPEHRESMTVELTKRRFPTFVH